MPVKILIDDIRAAAEGAGVVMRMARGRDLIAMLLFGARYSAVIAAERDGKLSLPKLVSSRTKELRVKYGAHVDVFVDVAAGVASTLLSNSEELAMTASQAIANRHIPAPPLLTLDILQSLQIEANKHRTEIEWITVNPGNLRQGKHLLFVRTAGVWHAFEDLIYDGVAYITAQFNGTIFRYREMDDDESTHQFLCHVFENGKWFLRFTEHSMAYAEHLDLTREELAEA